MARLPLFNSNLNSIVRVVSCTQRRDDQWYAIKWQCSSSCPTSPLPLHGFVLTTAGPIHKWQIFVDALYKSTFTYLLTLHQIASRLFDCTLSSSPLTGILWRQWAEKNYMTPLPAECQKEFAYRPAYIHLDAVPALDCQKVPSSACITCWRAIKRRKISYSCPLH